MRSVEQMFTRLPFLFVYLLYLDDAGSPGNPSEEYFVLGGICVYEAQVEWFSHEFGQTRDAIRQKPGRRRVSRFNDIFKARTSLEEPHR
jgi:hypothetical protein